MKRYTVDVILRLFALNEKLNESMVHGSYLLYDDLGFGIVDIFHREFSGRTSVPMVSTTSEYITQGASTYENVLRPRLIVQLELDGKPVQKNIGVLKWYVANEAKIDAIQISSIVDKAGPACAVFLKMEAWPTFATGHIGTETRPQNGTKIGKVNGTKVRRLSQLMSVQPFPHFAWENDTASLFNQMWLPNAGMSLFATDILRIKRDLMTTPEVPAFLAGKKLHPVANVEGDYDEVA
jgi:hypothetical protein